MTRALLLTQITQNEECISTKTIPNQSPSTQASILAWHREQQCQSWFHQRSRPTGHTHIHTYTRTDCCCSLVKLYPTLCSPMDSSTPGLPVPHHLPEFAQVHVHWIDDAIQPLHPLSKGFRGQNQLYVYIYSLFFGFPSHLPYRSPLYRLFCFVKELRNQIKSP